MRIKRERQPIQIECIDCAEVFTAYSRRALRCPECREIAKKKTSAEWMSKCRTTPYKQTKKYTPKLTIREVLRELEIYNKANKTHLSYGQFVAIMEKGA